MRAVILAHGDADAVPPRPTFIGTDEGTILTATFDIAAYWPAGWGPLYAVPIRMQAVQLGSVPGEPIIPVQTYGLTLPNGQRWTVRAAWAPQVATWFMRGEPELLPEPTELDRLFQQLSAEHQDS